MIIGSEPNLEQIVEIVITTLYRVLVNQPLGSYSSLLGTKREYTERNCMIT
ncbi:hypothetical protein D3C78_1700080 [compost metagenome]